jgi:diphosphomevalonate decarboxylase
MISNQVIWRSPSNIAFVKYWGKKGFQIPANPSLSMTLAKSFTETLVRYFPSEKPGQVSFEFSFEYRSNPTFAQKIEKFLQNIAREFPFILNYHFQIQSINTFPHSAGIASSASAMSTLALCICTIAQTLNGEEGKIGETFYRKASSVSRIGSGSAARSVFPGFALWGKTDLFPDSSDEFAIAVNAKINPVFEGFRDSILVTSKGIKKVSSREGHQLMENHPMAAARYLQAGQNLSKIKAALETGDLELFCKVVENEALTLHAMMMTSNPGYILMNPATLQIIEKIVDFRKQNGANVCFTLDAGPNVHVLFPQGEEKEVKTFIENDLRQYCEDGKIIHDRMGAGPERLT